MKSSKKSINQLELWSLDTEDDSKGNVELINFFNGVEHFSFPRINGKCPREKALQFFVTNACNWDIWTTNLQYDLVNLFGLHDMSLIEINYVGSRVISAKLPNSKVYFKDTLNHWKISVAEMGKRIGHEKLEGDIFDVNEKPTMNQLITRCERDSEITYFFVETMKEHYESIGGKLKATIGSTAMDYFSRHHYKHTKKSHFKTKDLEYLKNGYYGGRTEIFFNAPVEGNIQYYDFNSLYPSVMHKYNFPIIAQNCYKKTKNPNLQNHGVMRARVFCPDSILIPYLPFRNTNNALIFPTGTFAGVWSFFEIREAIKLGYKLEKIYSAIEFVRGNFHPFKDFVGSLYAKRMKAKQDKDELMSDAYKLIMNNLYGKFGQGRDFTTLIPFTKSSELKPGDSVLGDMILRQKRGGSFPTHTNFIWSILTTAYGRHELYMGMKHVVENGGLLIYCDTDSIIFESDKKLFKDNFDLGGLKSEGSFKYAHFKLPKLYTLTDSDNKRSFKAKGIPKKKAEDFFLKGKATFSKPYKLREAMRRNLSPKRVIKLIPNYWEEITKEGKKEYDKRIVNLDGTTTPIKIGTDKKVITNNFDRGFFRYCVGLSTYRSGTIFDFYLLQKG